MKPVSKRRNKREHVESEEDAPSRSASSLSTHSENSHHNEDINSKKSVKRPSVKKSTESDNESSDNESTKKTSKDARRPGKKTKYNDSDSENRDEGSEDTENDKEKSMKAKPMKVEKAKEETPKKGKGKRGRKPKGQPKNTNPTNGDADNVDYEVEAIMDQRMKFGKLQYRIRWKGFGPSEDSWERADGLKCPDIVKRYKLRVKEERDAESSADENTQEFEVGRILEVHFRRDGSREFLVGWKGFKNKDNTWEHETNMNCPEMIAQFMRRVDAAKTTTQRELREYREPTKHYTANSFNVLGRRLSGRSKDKPRVNYFYDDQY